MSDGFRSKRGYRGVLRDRGPGFGGTLVPSVLGHAAILAMLAWGAGADMKNRPLIDKDIYMVSAVVLPKAEGLPDKATAPPPPAPEAAPAAEPAPAAPPEPDRMVLKEDRPEPTPEVAEASAPKPAPRPARVKRPSRSELLARVGDESDTFRFETDPDGEEGAAPSGLRARFGKKLTPYQRRVADMIKENWYPRSSRGTPPAGMEAIVQFTIDDAGRIGDPQIAQGSSDYVYDQSCFRAVRRTGTLPKPPAGEPRTLFVRFLPEDKKL